MSLDLAELEERLGTLLSVGVAVSSAFLAIGLALDVLGVAPDASSWLLAAGLVILLGTPVMRVVVSLAAYVRQRDWFFTGLTTVVLCVLMLALTAAFGLMP